MKNRIELLITHLVNSDIPVLVESINLNEIPNSVVIDSNICDSDLFGYYEEFVFHSPGWLDEIQYTNDMKILIINNIDFLKKSEQRKFIDIIKYGQISKFDLPNNYKVLLVASDLSKVACSIKKLVINI